MLLLPCKEALRGPNCGSRCIEEGKCALAGLLGRLRDVPSTPVPTGRRTGRAWTGLAPGHVEHHERGPVLVALARKTRRTAEWSSESDARAGLKAPAGAPCRWLKSQLPLGT